MKVLEYASAAEMHAAHKERQRRLWAEPKPIMMAKVAKCKPAVPPELVRSMSIKVRIAGWQAWDKVGFTSSSIYMRQALTCERIIRLVCQAFDITKVDLLSDRRTRELVHPRQIACYLAKRLTSRSLPEIGRKMGGRDHTTVLHAVRKVEAMRADDPNFDAQLRSFEQILSN